jgi:hypothetical protein
MKRNLVIVGLCLAGVIGLLSQQALSGDIAKEMRQPTPDEQKAMMQEWMSLMEPSAGHKRLEPMIGEWDSVTKMWLGGPNMPPLENKGTCQREWVLGGRFVLEKIQSDMMFPDMAGGGMKKFNFEGMSLSGYDNFRNMYVGNWVDNMGTQMLTYEGSCDPSGKVFTYYGEMDEPGLKVVGRMVKYVTRIIDDDKHVMAMYDLHVGDDYKVMEVTYTRKKN